jgi:colanic acid biosynthesis protein WcaH
VIANAPLISIDICLVHSGNILLGKRVNPPAKNYYFTPGGRVFKNEPWRDAMKRIIGVELGLNLEADKLQLMGVWDHFYKDSAFNEKQSTHYVNLPHFFELDEEPHLIPDDQHDGLLWFALDKCKQNKLIHPYTQNYIRWILER